MFISKGVLVIIFGQNYSPIIMAARFTESMCSRNIAGFPNSYNPSEKPKIKYDFISILRLIREASEFMG